MLAHDGVIFAERHLFGDVARIFLGHVKEARVSGAEQLDLDRGWLRHGPFLCSKNTEKNCAGKNLRGSQRRANADSRAESQAHKQECNVKPCQYSTIYRVKPSVALSLALIRCHVGIALGHEYHILIRSVIAS
jgi:hypothetical protein